MKYFPQINRIEMQIDMEHYSLFNVKIILWMSNIYALQKHVFELKRLKESVCVCINLIKCKQLFHITIIEVLLLTELFRFNKRGLLVDETNIHCCFSIRGPHRKTQSQLFFAPIWVVNLVLHHVRLLY